MKLTTLKSILVLAIFIFVTIACGSSGGINNGESNEAAENATITARFNANAAWSVQAGDSIVVYKFDENAKKFNLSQSFDNLSLGQAQTVEFNFERHSNYGITVSRSRVNYASTIVSATQIQTTQDEEFINIGPLNPATTSMAYQIESYFNAGLSKPFEKSFDEVLDDVFGQYFDSNITGFQDLTIQNLNSGTVRKSTLFLKNNVNKINAIGVYQEIVFGLHNSGHAFSQQDISLLNNLYSTILTTDDIEQWSNAAKIARAIIQYPDRNEINGRVKSQESLILDPDLFDDQVFKIEPLELYNIFYQPISNLDNQIIILDKNGPNSSFITQLSDNNAVVSSFNRNVTTGSSDNLIINEDLTVSGNLLLGSSLISTILDEDTMVSNSNTALATQQSIKAYVDSQIYGSTSLSGLNDSSITSPSSGQILVYDGADSWDNQSISGDISLNSAGVASIVDGSINTTHLGTIVISAANISDNIISSANIVDNSITSDDLANQSVTSDKLDQNLNLSGNLSVGDNLIISGNLALGNTLISAVLDEDNMMSNSNTALATQQSIKTYIDSQTGGPSASISAMSDSEITSPASGQILIYDGTNSWDNKAVSGDISIDNAGIVTLANASVNTAQLGTVVISSANIEDNSVTTNKIATNAITSNELADNSVNTAHLGTILISAANISDDIISSANIVDGSIQTTDLANEVITSAKLDANITLSGNLTLGDNLNLGGNLIIDNAAISAILDEDGMTSNSDSALATQQSIKAYVDAQVGGSSSIANMSDSDVSSPASGHILIYDGTDSWDNKSVSGDITIDNAGLVTLANGSVNTAQLGTVVISSANIEDNSITTNKISPNAVTANELANASVNTAHFGTVVISAANITDDIISSANIVDGSIQTTDLADEAITSAKLDANITLSGNLTLGDNLNLGGNLIIDNAAISAILDEDGMTSNSAAALATQQSIKAYVDSQIGGSSSIANMSDSDISSPVSGHILIYDGTNSWDNKSVSGDISIDSAGLATLANGSVDTANLGTVLISSANIEDNSITTNKIDTNAVTSNELADNSVNTTHLGTVVISAANIADDIISSANIEDGSIQTSDLANGAITSAKLDSNISLSGNLTLGDNLNLDGNLIIDNTAVSAILDEDGMTSNSDSALATQQSIRAYVDAQVGGSSSIANMSDSDISSPSAGHLLIYDGSNSWDNKPVSGDIDINSSGLVNLANDSVDTAHLGTVVISSANLENNSITTNTILDRTILAIDIKADALTDNEIAADAITSSELANGSVNTSHLGTILISAANISDDIISSANIVDASIATADLADGSVTSDKLDNNITISGILASSNIQPLAGASGNITFTGNLIPSDNLSIGTETQYLDNIYTVNLTLLSDERKKKDIKNLNYGLSEIMKLRSATYKWKDRESETREIGLIAQEVRDVIPEAVSVSSDEKQMGIQYIKLVPVLIKGMQEQADLIKKQNEEIEILKQMVRDIKNRP